MTSKLEKKSGGVWGEIIGKGLGGEFNKITLYTSMNVSDNT